MANLKPCYATMNTAKCVPLEFTPAKRDLLSREYREIETIVSSLIIAIPSTRASRCRRSPRSSNTRVIREFVRASPIKMHPRAHYTTARLIDARRGSVRIF